MSRRRFILLIITILCVAAGLWLVTASSRERQGYFELQDALLEDILACSLPCDGYNELPEEDFHMEQSNAHQYLVYEWVPLPTSVPAALPPVFPSYTLDPIPDHEFPSTIIGLGILTIERINLRLPVAEGVDYDTLRITVGRVPQTAQIGDIGNAVIAGHRNYTFGQMFNRLEELEIGDSICFQARNGEVMRFVVFEVAEIYPEDQIAFIQPMHKSVITLYTCTPVRVASHRLLVRAKRVP